MSDVTDTASSIGDTCLDGGGEAGAMMRRIDWAKSPLGPVSQWPQSLKTCVRIVLTSRQPMFVWWGRSLINLYNDAYRSILGGKHPTAMARPAAEVWAEIWDQIGPRAESAMRNNEGTYDEALMLIMERNGYPEETHYTFSYSPVPDDQGKPGGILCANSDDTALIIGERQIALLRELASATADARSAAEACHSAANALATNPRDIPFAIICVHGESGLAVCPNGTVGIDQDHPAVVSCLAPNTAWPIHEVAATHRAQLIDHIDERFANLPRGIWNRVPTQALVIPIAASGAEGKSAVLIAALNPYRLLDENYRGFLGLVAGQIAASIANATAYEAERRRAEELAELDRAKTAFFSNVSHEFRTPLTLMLSPLEDVLARHDLPDSSSVELRVVQRNGMRLLKLVNTLLDFSRVEAGRVQASYVPTNIAAATADLASVFRSAIERAGLSFTVTCNEIDEPVYIDRDMWEKIVLNLLSNAFKFTLKGEIAVLLECRNHQLEMSVRDTGSGIPAQELPRIFERFHRVIGSEARTHEGTGIGLALVNELVKLHGGSVTARSQVGVGSTFVVRIPTGKAHLPADRIAAAKTLVTTATGADAYLEEALRWLPEGAQAEDPAPPGEPAKRQPSAQAPGLTQGRIVLADDNADMRRYVARLLSFTYEVEAVADGQLALDAIRRNSPDLVLSDVMMPRLDGFALLAELRKSEATRSIPVILLSARAGEEARVEGIASGADDYLVKPFSAKELLARVSGVLALSRARAEASKKERELRERAEAAQAEAERAGRMKDEFLATLSHELRTPLNAILGWSQILGRMSHHDEDLKQGIETIERNARVQARLIEDLLDMSRIISGKLRLDVKRISPATFIDAAFDTLRPTAAAKGVELRRSVEESSAVVSGDAARLQQVLWNLMSNAIKFTPRGGLVDVRLEKAERSVCISVVDTGAGIEPEFLPHVFERFRQADASTTRRHGGLGLGLAIVKHLTELHGGFVQASSAGRGKGSAFSITLPLLAEEDVASRPPPAHQRRSERPAVGRLSLAGLQVLVVDDEPDARLLLRRVLSDAGAEILLAESAEQAIEILGHSKIDVIISDIGMPGADGYEFMRRVRQTNQEASTYVPAIAMTAFARREDRARALLAGYQLHVAKPFEPAELIAAVATLAGKAGVLR